MAEDLQAELAEIREAVAAIPREFGTLPLDDARASSAAGVLRAKSEKLLAAAVKSLSFHERVTLYEPDTHCGHDIDAGDWPQHFEGDDGVWYCRDRPLMDVCSTCVSDSGAMASWPCPEYAAILAELTGKENDGG